jgi:subtilisin family serine protease
LDQACSERIISEDYADFIIEYDQIPESLKAIPNFCYDVINSVHVSAYVPIEHLPNNLIQTYTYSIFPSCYGLLDIGSLDAAGITRVQNIPTLNLTGQGVLIGILDTGIEYTHEAFKNADGTSRIVSIWDQTIQSDSAPEGFFYGTEYTIDQINTALSNENPLSIVPSTDTNGHGTYIAGIAAGNKNEAKKFSGVATNAQLVVVKLKSAKRYIRDFYSISHDVDCYQENDIMYAIKYLLTVASRLAKPISLCIALGTSQGAHDSRNPLGNYLTAVADQKGVGISIGAGNEGNRNHHFSGVVDTTTGYSTVELKVGPNTSGFSMELWGNSPNLFSIDILSPTGEYISRIPARLKETREIRFIFEETVIFVDYEIVESQTGDQLILIRFQKPTEGIWRFRVYSSINFDPRFHIWLPIYNFIDDATLFTQPDPDSTLTNPGNTALPIIVTAYDYNNQNLFINASRGYTRNNIINPTFAAPGVNILGPSLNNEYKTSSGTSVSAAFTAGVVAMFFEWGASQENQTQFETLEIKNFLIRGAKRDPNIVYPNKEWGYGILDVFNAFNSLRG